MNQSAAKPILPYLKVPLTLIEDANLTPNELKVLCAIKSHRSTFIHYYDQGLDLQTGLTRQTVSRIVHGLKEAGYITSITKIDHREASYRLNPYSGGMRITMDETKWATPRGTRSAPLSNLLCRYGEISPVEFRILAWIRANNGIRAKPNRIREALRIMQPAVSAAMDRLIANQILYVDNCVVVQIAKYALASKARGRGILSINAAKIPFYVSNPGKWKTIIIPGMKPTKPEPVIKKQPLSFEMCHAKYNAAISNPGNTPEMIEAIEDEFSRDILARLED